MMSVFQRADAGAGGIDRMSMRGRGEGIGGEVEFARKSRFGRGSIRG